MNFAESPRILYSEIGVSQTPEISTELANWANVQAEERINRNNMNPGNFSALNSALSLCFYNFRRNIDHSDYSNRRFETYLSSIIQNEKVAHDTPFLLPIGTEIEAKQFSFVKNDKDQTKLRDFYSILNLPENEANYQIDYTTDKLDNYWEFSPDPSYSSYTQSVILHQLIQGGFIPHLHEDQPKNRIYSRLLRKGISLHINVPISNYTNREEFSLLLKSFALAYTSEKRLKNRTNKAATFRIKYQELKPTDKNPKYGISRLEFIAAEVRDKQVYKLLRDYQLLISLADNYAKNQHMNPIFETLFNCLNSSMENIYTLTGNNTTAYLNESIENYYNKSFLSALRYVIHASATTAAIQLYQPDQYSSSASLLKSLEYISQAKTIDEIIHKIE